MYKFYGRFYLWFLFFIVWYVLDEKLTMHDAGEIWLRNRVRNIKFKRS